MAITDKSSPSLPNLLLVDDDVTYCGVLGSALERQGYNVYIAHDIASAMRIVGCVTPDFAVIDLKLGGESGLALLTELFPRFPALKSVMLTGYASISTAVESIKLGATHYLTKPADADEIIASFTKGTGNANTAITAGPLSLDNLEREYIQRVLAECNGSISSAARRLKMHRRTLQRKLRRSSL